MLMIMSGLGVKQSHEINSAFVSISDLAPTFYEMAGATYPAGLAAMMGKCILPILSSQVKTVHTEDDALYSVNRTTPVCAKEGGSWSMFMFHLMRKRREQDDPGETTDLSASHPGKRADLTRQSRLRGIETSFCSRSKPGFLLQ